MKKKNALEMFVEAIEATGGVIRFSNGTYGPYADEEWTDIGEIYIQACAELKLEAMIDDEVTTHGI